MITWRKRFFGEGTDGLAVGTFRSPGPFPRLVVAEVKQLARELPERRSRSRV